MTDAESSMPANGRGGPQRIPRPPGVRPGDPAPWEALPPGVAVPSLDEIVSVMASTRPPRRSPIEGIGGARSAVLAAFYEDAGEVHIVLTRRSWHLRSHAGEVSFPGGRQDPGESLWETALREAWEEVALDPASVQAIGELDHLATVSSRSAIVPYVGVLPGRPDLVANPSEVDAVLHVPVAELLAPGTYRQERWGVPRMDRPIHFFDIEGDTIWGATGSMLVDLLSRVTRAAG